MSYLKDAFKMVIEQANLKEAEVFYVTLWEINSYYGGPEEGGWWGEDHLPIGYSTFLSMDEAQKAKHKIEELALELKRGEYVNYGQTCLKEIEFLDSRGLDYDYLPESDGPSSYSVTIDNDPPQMNYGSRNYE